MTDLEAFNSVLTDLLAQRKEQAQPKRPGPKSAPMNAVLYELVNMVQYGDGLRGRGDVSRVHYNTLSLRMGHPKVTEALLDLLAVAMKHRWGPSKMKTLAAKRNELLLRSLCEVIASIVISEGT